MKTEFTENIIKECQEKFNLTYHVPYAAHCQNAIGFEGKDVLEVGGSLPPDFTFDYLKASSWTALETSEYADALKDAGGLTHKGTILHGDNSKVIKGFGPVKESKYNFFLANIEEIPETHYDQYDLVFSIATFEHIHKLPQALNKMHLSLRYGGKLFSLFSPVWSSYNGHHIPQITDSSGQTITMNKSPIPPWGHLLMTPSQMHRYLKTKIDSDTADLLTYYIYNAPSINRFFLEDYVEFINDSKFNIIQLEGVFPVNLPDNIRKDLESLYPNRKHFNFQGILAILEKK